MSIVPYTPGQLRMRIAERYPHIYPIKPAYYYWYPLFTPYITPPPVYYLNPYTGYSFPTIYRTTPWPVAYPI